MSVRCLHGRKGIRTAKKQIPDHESERYDTIIAMKTHTHAESSPYFYPGLALVDILHIASETELQPEPWWLDAKLAPPDDSMALPPTAYTSEVLRSSLKLKLLCLSTYSYQGQSLRALRERKKSKC